MTQKPMTKTQLVTAIAEAAGLDKTAASRALDALTEIVTREVAAGGAVKWDVAPALPARNRPIRRSLRPSP